MNIRAGKIFLVLLTWSISTIAQTNNNNSPAPVFPIPSPEQMLWHEMETNAFVHFTTNTFTGLEWGYGDEKESIFNPTALDAVQWAKTLKETGFKTMICFNSISI